METSNITSVLERAKLTVEDAEDLVEDISKIDSNEEALCCSLQRGIHNLGLLNASLELPTTSDGPEEKVIDSVRTEIREPYQYFAELVAARFPRADPQLAQNLGQSNWDRYNHVQRQREAFQSEEEAIPD